MNEAKCVEILEEIFNPVSQPCQTQKEDLQLAITLNPELYKIIMAMEKYMESEVRDIINLMCETNEDVIFANHLLTERGIEEI